MEEQVVVKRKRGRPRKNPVIETAQFSGGLADLLEDFSILNDNVDEQIVDSSSGEQVNVEPIHNEVEDKPCEQEKIDLTTESAEPNIESAENEQSVPEVVYEDPSEFMERKKQEVFDKINNEQEFDFGDAHYICFKHKIGSKVWVPVSSVKNIGSTFGTIKAVQIYEPKKFTIAAVQYTNHIQYTFKETSKVIAAEKFVFVCEELCKEMCDNLNK